MYPERPTDDLKAFLSNVDHVACENADKKYYFEGVIGYFKANEAVGGTLKPMEITPRPFEYIVTGDERASVKTGGWWSRLRKSPRELARSSTYVYVERDGQLCLVGPIDYRGGPTRD